MQITDTIPAHSRIVPWKQKALEAEVRIEPSDITTEQIEGNHYPTLKPHVLQNQFEIFKGSHVLRLRNLADALQESAGKSLDPKEVTKAVRALQYLSTVTFTMHIMNEDPGFLGEEKGGEIVPYAETYSVVRQTPPHCHGRTVHGSLFSLGYGSGTDGVKSSGNLTLWNLAGAGIEKTDEHFVVDKENDWYLRKQSLPQIESVDLPPIAPEEQPIVIIHDGVTAHSNTKVELSVSLPTLKRLINFVEMCSRKRLNPSFLAEKFSPHLIKERRDGFIGGKIIGVLDKCPDT